MWSCHSVVTVVMLTGNARGERGVFMVESAGRAAGGVGLVGSALSGSGMAVAAVAPGVVMSGEALVVGVPVSTGVARGGAGAVLSEGTAGLAAGGVSVSDVFSVGT
jgi:hypothetical protein